MKLDIQQCTLSLNFCTYILLFICHCTDDRTSLMHILLQVFPVSMCQGPVQLTCLNVQDELLNPLHPSIDGSSINVKGLSLSFLCLCDAPQHWQW